uniref:Uncharacterized protein n=1 Tax=Monodon monoceros TaxID=40151 RepID=A0A8C6ANW6_MONMO
MDRLWNIRRWEPLQGPLKWVPTLGELQKTLQKGDQSRGPSVCAPQNQPSDHGRGRLPARPGVARHPAGGPAPRGQGALQPRPHQVPPSPHPLPPRPHLLLFRFHLLPLLG